MGAAEIAQKVTQVTEASNGNANLEGYVKRATRDGLIAKELESIKNTCGEDRAKYIDRVVAAAEKILEENKVDLIKLKELRETPGSNPDEAKALFDKNPKLVEARAYLILAASFGDKSKYSAYIDNDASTNAMITSLSQKVQEGLAVTDAKQGLNAIHTHSLEHVDAQIDLILQHLQVVNSRKPEGEAPKGAGTENPPPSEEKDEEENEKKPDPNEEKKKDEELKQDLMAYDASKISKNVTGKSFIGNNKNLATWMIAAQSVGEDVKFVSQIRFKDAKFGNPNRDGTTDYITGDNGNLLMLQNPTDILRALRKSPEAKEDNYIDPNFYENLGIYRIGSVRIKPDYANTLSMNNKDLREKFQKKYDEALQTAVKEFLESGEKAMPVFLVRTGQEWHRRDLKGEVAYLPREEVIKQFGLEKK